MDAEIPKVSIIKGVMGKVWDTFSECIDLLELVNIKE